MAEAVIISLKSEDIRYIRPSQLSVLTGISATSFPRWDQGGRMSERSLERIAKGLWTNKHEVLMGFELRRNDVLRARAAQEKADQIIALLREMSTPA